MGKVWVVTVSSAPGSDHRDVDCIRSNEVRIRRWLAFV